MNVFDILGPVMIGPSSSHTAGAARIGLVTRALLGKTPVKAHIFLHGSFAKTYKGHGRCYRTNRKFIFCLNFTFTSNFIITHTF